MEYSWDPCGYTVFWSILYSPVLILGVLEYSSQHCAYTQSSGIFLRSLWLYSVFWNILLSAVLILSLLEYFSEPCAYIQCSGIFLRSLWLCLAFWSILQIPLLLFTFLGYSWDPCAYTQSSGMFFRALYWLVSSLRRTKMILMQICHHCIIVYYLWKSIRYKKWTQESWSRLKDVTWMDYEAQPIKAESGLKVHDYIMASFTS